MASGDKITITDFDTVIYYSYRKGNMEMTKDDFISFLEKNKKTVHVSFNKEMYYFDILMEGHNYILPLNDEQKEEYQNNCCDDFLKKLFELSTYFYDEDKKHSIIENVERTGKFPSMEDSQVYLEYLSKKVEKETKAYTVGSAKTVLLGVDIPLFIGSFGSALLMSNHNSILDPNEKVAIAVMVVSFVGGMVGLLFRDELDIPSIKELKDMRTILKAKKQKLMALKKHIEETSVEVKCSNVEEIGKRYNDNFCNLVSLLNILVEQLPEEKKMDMLNRILLLIEEYKKDAKEIINGEAKTPSVTTKYMIDLIAEYIPKVVGLELEMRDIIYKQKEMQKLDAETTELTEEFSSYTDGYTDGYTDELTEGLGGVAAAPRKMA